MDRAVATACGLVSIRGEPSTSALNEALGLRDWAVNLVYRPLNRRDEGSLWGDTRHIRLPQNAWPDAPDQPRRQPDSQGDSSVDATGRRALWLLAQEVDSHETRFPRVRRWGPPAPRCRVIRS
jgi:hypothetical protein